MKNEVLINAHIVDVSSDVMRKTSWLHPVPSSLPGPRHFVRGTRWPANLLEEKPLAPARPLLFIFNISIVKTCFPLRLAAKRGLYYAETVRLNVRLGHTYLYYAHVKEKRHRRGACRRGLCGGDFRGGDTLTGQALCCARQRREQTGIGWRPTQRTQ